MCESITSGIICFEFIPGYENPVHILTKALPWHNLQVNIEPLLVWKGETISQESSTSMSLPKPRGEVWYWPRLHPTKNPKRSLHFT